MISKDDFELWKLNPSINPITKRKIKINGPIYKKFMKLENNNNERNDVNEYIHFRRNKIDPILFIELPLDNMKINDVFTYKNKWNPYNGEIIEIDKNGPLYFDPNALVHYFYINRLNNLWINDSYENNEYIEGHYGDAVGNGPHFNINGRGNHPDWYLFRLPIIDCYLDKNHCYQSVTMGPILNDDEIKRIFNLSKRYKKFFKETYGYKRPNLVEMKKIYDKAIDKNDIYDSINELTNEEKTHLKYQDNLQNVELLKKFK